MCEDFSCSNQVSPPMILSLGKRTTQESVEKVVRRLLENGLESQVVVSGDITLVVVTSDAEAIAGHFFSQLEGVEKVVKLTNRTPLAADSCAVVNIGKIDGPRGRLSIGGGQPVVIAGPCSVESKEHIFQTAEAVRNAGAKAVRGGAYKPRTSPYDFQGLGLDGLKFMAEAGEKFKLPVISEVMAIEHIASAEPYVDMFQVGARNMYNYELLKELGRQSKPVLLKRAMSATIDELLQSAEYILASGNLQVVLCERGIRTFETRVRNTLDLSAVAVLKSLTNLPVLVDPSHATGKRDYVRALSRAAIACGADGLVIESHCQPDKSVSDAAQAITPDTLKQIVLDSAAIYQALNLRDQDKPVVSSCEPVVLR